MTVKLLLGFFEAYYGEKYTGIFLDTMLDYFDECSTDFLEAVRKVIILRYPRSFNKAPDVAVIEKNIGEIHKAMEDIKNRNALPEPPTVICSSEEAEKYISEIKRTFKNTHRGGLASSLMKVVSNCEMRMNNA